MLPVVAMPRSRECGVQLGKLYEAAEVKGWHVAHDAPYLFYVRFRRDGGRRDNRVLAFGLDEFLRSVRATVRSLQDFSEEAA